jgi:AraC family transcriptional regulator of adaptative response/methylated-DNA-[protein]-cysteine methyltransferase
VRSEDDRAPVRFATDAARWNAVVARDAAATGTFVYGVTTTGVVCRPACPSRTPRRENVVFFDAVTDAERAGFRPCRRCHAGRAASDPARALTIACALLSADDDGVRMADVARTVGMTPASLARAFRAKLGVTPRQYRQRLLAARAKAALAKGARVTDAVYDAGYSTSSRFYESAGRELGMTPAAARRGGSGQRVAYTTRPTSLGMLGIAWTSRGVSDVAFVEDAGAFATALQRRWPAAERARAALPPWIDRVVAAVERPAVADVPLDVQGTAFEERVWRALRAIPAGATRSYADVAKRVGAAGAHRAVARAIGRNPLAVLVPCHRVVAADGTLAGYRWGLARKAELLRRERDARPVARRRAAAR